MNTRKFTYITTLVVGIFLFVLGTVFMFYINNVKPESGAAPLKGILKGLNSASDIEPMNFLLLVEDKSSGNTDVMLVANYNPESDQISLVTIPRDTKVKVKGSNVPKINSAYWAGGRNHEGCVNAANYVSDLTGININYYAHIDISCIKEIVDKLGGVNFDVPADLRYNDPTQDLYIDLKKGYQLLNGDKAEQLLRFRKPQASLYTAEELKEVNKIYSESDIARTEIQSKFIKEFISQKLRIQYLPQFNPVIRYVFQNIITNMELNDALKLASGLVNISTDNFNTFRLDGEDKYINRGWYYVYNGKIANLGTKESLPAEDVVAKYFYSSNGISQPSGELYVPEEAEDSTSTKKPAASTKKNPSNADTDVKDKNDKA